VERIHATPRRDWPAIVESQGFIFHSTDAPYWNEEAFYRFTAHEVGVLEQATSELHARCLDAVQYVIDRNRYHELGVPAHAIPLIERSWEAEPPSLYGRFDLAYDGSRPPVMLEYNADTPTSLLEASVIQWYWLEETHEGADQFNSLHERLIETWKELKPHLHGSVLHFSGVDATEDVMTLAYLQDCASQAGILTKNVRIDAIEYDHREERFVDQELLPLAEVFKLYPWEWLVQEKFGDYLGRTAGTTRWIEPAWKMVLANKGILAVLWEMFPGHPNLVPTYLRSPREMRSFAKKPLFSREGANVSLIKAGKEVDSGADQGYGEEGYVYQQLVSLKTFAGKTPIIGSWVIGQVAAGIGIREADGLVTGNLSRFVPHLF
jgi:glutathionylspermidine synthase